MPELKYEKDLWQKGLRLVAGIDEAGRGPLAGPVVAAAVVFDQNMAMIEGVRDSKMISARKREQLYDKIIANTRAIGVGLVGPEEIDRTNVLRATHKAMRQAIGRLKLKIDHILVDGRGLPDKIYPQTAIVGGDRLCYSIAAASIIAKVYRDRIMIAMDQVFPGYGFAKHKGYGTAEHLKAIQKLRPCPIHRKSFHGVREYLIDIQKVANSRYLGKFGEDLAAYYLYNNGFTIIQRNFHAGAYGEIDIIAVKDEVLSFIEVKTQRHQVFGKPAGWVDERKMEQLGLIADAFLSRHPELDLDCRFDVIGVTITKSGYNLRYVQDAFRL
jgi:ribonuclease HII